jgi:hypothetical protein
MVGVQRPCFCTAILSHHHDNVLPLNLASFPPHRETQVAVGSYIYEYADWGGIIVMARHPGANDKPAGGGGASQCLFTDSA